MYRLQSAPGGDLNCGGGGLGAAAGAARGGAPGGGGGWPRARGRLREASARNSLPRRHLCKGLPKGGRLGWGVYDRPKATPPGLPAAPVPPPGNHKGCPYSGAGKMPARPEGRWGRHSCLPVARRGQPHRPYESTSFPRKRESRMGGDGRGWAGCPRPLTLALSPKGLTTRQFWVKRGDGGRRGSHPVRRALRRASGRRSASRVGGHCSASAARG